MIYNDVSSVLEAAVQQIWSANISKDGTCEVEINRSELLGDQIYIYIARSIREMITLFCFAIQKVS
jgi:hypothetical protein